MSFQSIKSKEIVVSVSFGPLKIADKPPNYIKPEKKNLITQEYIEEWKISTLPRSPKFKARPNFNINNSQNSVS